MKDWQITINGSNIMKNLEYACCFCGNKITSSGTDITGLIVIANWDKSVDKQQEQQLFCHMQCLKERMDKSTPLYIADLVD